MCVSSTFRHLQSEDLYITIYLLTLHLLAMQSQLATSRIVVIVKKKALILTLTGQIKCVIDGCHSSSACWGHVMV